MERMRFSALSVNLTIQAIRAFRRRNAPLAFALCTLYVSPALRLLSLSFFTVSDSDVDRV
ncbi:putative transmembrane protein [Toxoplasma gondii VAND]|uniref:Putative transmembrane protein n=2 Tax=Toxoplasma gondii TaxID=5811 RepID=A0A086PNY2_TOXGO|nr:putative transmembrane protein [Toxoplasma gondii VAND]